MKRIYECEEIKDPCFDCIGKKICDRYRCVFEECDFDKILHPAFLDLEEVNIEGEI